MTRVEFLKFAAEAIDSEAALELGQALPEIDSLMVLNLIELFDRIGVQLEATSFENVRTSDDLLAMTDGKLSG